MSHPVPIHTTAEDGTNLFLIFGFVLSTALIGGAFWWLYRFFRAGYKTDDAPFLGGDTICIDCGTSGQARKVKKGSGSIEALLWIVVVSAPIALIYSVWRRAGSVQICAVCSGRLIPASSPQGKILAKKFSAEKR